VAGVFGLKGGSECTKRPNKIENGPIMKLGIQDPRNTGLENAQRGGTMLHFNVPVFHVLDFQLLVYGHFLMSPSDLRRYSQRAPKRSSSAGNIDRKGV
jgi:hypothetical protein